MQSQIRSFFCPHIDYVLIVLTEELGVIPTFPCGACSYMVNPPLIRLIFCLAHLSSNMSVLASVSISSNVRKGMFIFNATFLEALYSYLFLYGALLNASSLWFVFFCIFWSLIKWHRYPLFLLQSCQFNWAVKIYN